jgi:hypothetical protein
MFMFGNRFIFYGEGLLAQHPTPKQEYHPLSFFRGCLFNISASILHSWRPLGYIYTGYIKPNGVSELYYVLTLNLVL